MTTTTQKLKKPFLVLFLIVATELIGFGLIIPILPQLALQFNVGGFWMGLLLCSYSLAQFIASPVLGQLSDKIGRKPVLVASKLGTALSYLLLANASTYPLFLLARLLDGFTGGNIAVARAYVSDITTPENRTKGMAIIGMSFGVGFVLGPALGGFLFGMYDTHFIPCLIAGGLSLLATLFTIILLEEPKKLKSKQSNKVSNLKLLTQKNIGIILITQFIFMCCFAAFETTFSVFMHTSYNFTAQDNSQLFLYLGLLALFIQGGIVRKSFKNLRLATILGLLLTAVTFIGLSFTPKLWVLYAALIVLSFGIALLNTHLPALLSQQSQNTNNGQVMGLYESVGSISRIIGPLVIYTSFFTKLSTGYTIAGALLGFSILVIYNYKTD